LISIGDYFTLHGTPDDDRLRANAAEWVRRANLLLKAAARDGISPGIDQVSKNHVASGYRPAGVNAATSNAAKRSTHLTCEGGDVQDRPDRQLAVWCARNQDKMAEVGLWMEDPRWTGGRTNTDPWCHWQTKPPGSGKRIYVPSSAAPTDPKFYGRNGLPVPA